MPNIILQKVLSADSLVGTTVKNAANEELGEIKSIMIDITSGRVAYAVLSFGGFLGLGDKLFAIPWEAFSVSREEEIMYLNVPKEKLERAPGFDKDNWPDMADPSFGSQIYNYYGYKAYWN